MPPAAPRPDPRIGVLLRQSANLRAEGRLAEAVAPLRQAAQLAPASAPIQHDLGLLLLSLGNPSAALSHFDKAVAIDPAFGAAHFRRGIALEMQLLPGAAEAYRCAIESGFASAELFSRLAALLHQAGRRDDAAPLYRHAASLAPGSPAALMDAARAALIDNDIDEAEPLLRQVLARQPDAASARGHLAHILRARGDFAAAAAELEQAIASRPEFIGLYDDLVQARGGADPALVARMRAASTQHAPLPQRIKLHLALARALDHAGDYAEAAAELQNADALRAIDNPFDRAALARQHDQIVALFTQAYMASPYHHGSPSDLPILIVGMPRSGTTLLEQILASHPAAAGAGEVHFWEAQGRAFLPAADPRLGADLRAVAGAYLAKLQRHRPAARHVVDKMPFNFRWAPLIHLAFPNARIIHCRRHPADTCLSIMSNDLVASPSFSARRDDLLFFYRIYQRLAAHARALLPPSVFLELNYEELVADPEQQIRALLDFCGLPFDPACLAPERNRRVVLTFSQFQARQPITAAASGRWRRYGDWLRDFASLEKKG